MTPTKGTGPRKGPIRRVNPLLPPKPKKALTGYNLFLKAFWAHKNPSKPGNADYVKMNSPPAGVTFGHLRETPVDPLTGKKPRADFRVPAATWNNLTERQRKAYKSKTEIAKAEYKIRIDEWKAVKKALKKPASSYALFVKEIWARDGMSKRSFAQMSQHASSLWKILSKRGKDYYKEQHQLDMIIYSHKIDFIRINGRLPIGEELIEYVQNAEAPPAPSKVENEIEEDEVMNSDEENEEEEMEGNESEDEGDNEDMSSDEENEDEVELEVELEGGDESEDDSDEE